MKETSPFIKVQISESHKAWQEHLQVRFHFILWFVFMTSTCFHEWNLILITVPHKYYVLICLHIRTVYVVPAFEIHFLFYVMRIQEVNCHKFIYIVYDLGWNVTWMCLLVINRLRSSVWLFSRHKCMKVSSCCNMAHLKNLFFLIVDQLDMTSCLHLVLCFGFIFAVCQCNGASLFSPQLAVCLNN